MKESQGSVTHKPTNRIIVTKGLSEHSQRILALENTKFKKCENNNIMGYNDYYISVKD